MILLVYSHKHKLDVYGHLKIFTYCSNMGKNEFEWNIQKS